MFNLKKTVSALVIGAFSLNIAGCASSADDINAQYVSDLQYSSYTCEQLAEESARINARVAEVTGQQDDAAQSDAVVMGVGLVLFWPALFFLAATDDQKAELGRIKGEAEALHRAGIKKNCTTASNPSVSAPTTPSEL